MGQFVGHHVGDPEFAVQRRDIRLEEQEDFPIGDQAPVLHGTEAEVGQGDHVHFGEGKLLIEVLLEELENLGTNLTGVFGLI